jgi:hypothetical protein
MMEQQADNWRLMLPIFLSVVQYQVMSCVVYDNDSSEMFDASKPFSTLTHAATSTTTVRVINALQRRYLSTHFIGVAFSVTRSSLGQRDEFVDGASGCNKLGLAGSRQSVEALIFLRLFLAAAMLDRIGQAYTDVKGASGLVGFFIGRRVRTFVE